jgi:hypothetical protein
MTPLVRLRHERGNTEEMLLGSKTAVTTEREG